MRQMQPATVNEVTDMKGTVDRIEGNFAVCHIDGWGFRDIPLDLFPEKPGSGEVFCLEGDTITFLKKETESRKKKAQLLFDRLKKRTQ